MIWGPADGVIMNIDSARSAFPGQQQLSISHRTAAVSLGVSFPGKLIEMEKSISLGQGGTFLWFQAVYHTKEQGGEGE